MLSNRTTTIIPFEIMRNLIIIHAQVNGNNNYSLILDTGMPMDGVVLLNNPRVDELNLKYLNQTVIAGAGKDMTSANMATGVTLGFPGMELRNQTVVVMPPNSNISWLGVHGIIGYALFSRFVVEIDYDDLVITLTEPDQFTYWGSGQKLTLVVEHGFPFLTCSGEMLNGVTLPLNLVIDSGNSGALLLDVESHKDITIPQGAIEHLIGKGVGGEITGHIGRINSLRLGKFNLKNVISGFTYGPVAKCAHLKRAQHGNLGSDVLCRFNVTFDYLNQYMILEPNSHFHKSFEFNMAGIGYIKQENSDFKIEYVIPDSPAEESGLEKNDIILKINGSSVAQFEWDDLHKLLTNEGEVIFLEISRGSEKINVSVRLRKLI